MSGDTIIQRSEAMRGQKDHYHLKLMVTMKFRFEMLIAQPKWRGFLVINTRSNSLFNISVRSLIIFNYHSRCFPQLL